MIKINDRAADLYALSPIFHQLHLLAEWTLRSRAVMSATRKLDRILVEETPSGCRLTIEDVNGEAYQIVATEEQIKNIIGDLTAYLRDAAEEDALMEYDEMGDE